MSNKVELEAQWKEEMVKLAHFLLQKEEVDAAVAATKKKLAELKEQYAAAEKAESEAAAVVAEGEQESAAE